MVLRHQFRCLHDSSNPCRRPHCLANWCLLYIRNNSLKSNRINRFPKNVQQSRGLYYIQGELFGDQPGSESFHLDVAIQQSIHQFHGETWSFFTFCNIWNESIGKEGEKLVGPGRGHFSSWCDLHSVCPDPHQDPNRSKWIYYVSDDMKRFEMALFDKQGRWKQNTSPLDHDAHSIGVHPHAAVALAPNKGFRAILEAIVTTCKLLGDSPRYWRYTGETTPHHWKDGGLSLTNAWQKQWNTKQPEQKTQTTNTPSEHPIPQPTPAAPAKGFFFWGGGDERAGRWRSDSCLWFIKKERLRACASSHFFFLRLPNGQYGPVSRMSQSKTRRCTGPFNWGGAHCAGEKVKRKTGPFLQKSHSKQAKQTGTALFFARRPIGPCNLVLFVHHRLMRDEKPVHDSRIGAEPFLHCET